MRIIRDIGEMQQLISSRKKQGESVGFIPTMGFLHEGHISLIEHANKHCDIVVVSIFVNPLQFGPNEDYDRYPRDLERDERLARERGTDVLFCPTADDMYPDGAGVRMEVHRRTDVLCGAKRPGHFDGVVTVLTKLFHIVQPDKAFFGLKDAQQVAVVDDLITSHFFPIELVACPTVREEDGLAKSSRNIYLTESERAVAPFLYQHLAEAKKRVLEGMALEETLQRLITGFEQIPEGKLDYVEIRSFPDLESVTVYDQPLIIAVAYQFKKARLIDNIVINENL
jgi:pantoate--beta-alanine ligase